MAKLIYLFMFPAITRIVNCAHNNENVGNAAQAQKRVITVERQRELDFITAAKTGNIHLLNDYISTNINVHARDDEADCTALHWAADKEHIAIIIKLLKAGADVNARSFGGQTPVMESAGSGRIAALNELLKAGANIHARDVSGHTALHWAARNEQQHIVKFLLKQTALNINCKTTDQNKSAFTYAAEKNNVEMVRLLLGQSELDLAEDIIIHQLHLLKNHVIKNLIKCKLNGWHGNLFYAVLGRKLDQVKKLVAQVKDVLFFDDEGNNLLHVVIKNIKDTDPQKAKEQGDVDALILDLLLSINPELLQYDNRAGLTPIDLAVQKPQILKYLFDIAYAEKEEVNEAVVSMMNTAEVATSVDGKYLAVSKK